MLSRHQPGTPWTWDQPNPPDPIEPQYPDAGDRPELATLRQRIEMSALLAEAVSRRKEALKLYRPYPIQEDFHASQATYRLARGGNRGGKTLCVAVELARAITNQDPYRKYPLKGRAIAAGKDLLDVSKVVYRKLFKPGAIKIIRDDITAEWRAYDPRCDYDREKEAVDAPPLVAQRFYDPRHISWEDKREEVPRTIRLKTGWELTFFSGQGDPPQGWDVDLIVMDEEIPNPAWFREMVPRLVDRRGRLIWSATAQVGTMKLFELSQRAAELKEKNDPEPRVTEHVLNIFTNPYISEKDRDNFVTDLKADGEDEFKVRGLGEFAIHGQRIYAEFQKHGVHQIKPFPIPEDWTRYVATDPGRRVSASLFVAVPPPHCEYDRPIVYGELYLRQCNALIYGQKMKEFLGESYVQTWLIDHQEGRKTETGSGLTIEEQYDSALQKFHCTDNGFRGFTWASSDIDAGITAAKTTLQLVDGRPNWLFMTENLGWFTWEIERYLDQKVLKTGIIWDRPLGGQDHLMDCFRYIALHPLKYRKPPPAKRKKGWTTEYIKAKKKKHAQADGWGGAIRMG